MKPLDGLLKFARLHNLHVTSTTGGSHNTGSLHFRGRAIDVRSRTLTDQKVTDLGVSASGHNILMRDERVRPVGQKVWGGPHLHFELPIGVEYREFFT